MWTHGNPWLRKGVTAASRSLPGDQGLVNERTEVTSEVKADVAPPPPALSEICKTQTLNSWKKKSNRAKRNHSFNTWV